MDWSTVALSVVSALISGGIIGGFVSLRVASKESSDRKAGLALEREKWEHEKAKSSREQARVDIKLALTELDNMLLAVTRLRRSQTRWQEAGTIDPEVRSEVRDEYEELNRVNAIMPSLITSLYIAIGGSDPEPKELVGLLVSAQQAYGNYALSCFMNEQDDSLYSDFGSSHLQATLSYKDVLSRLG